MLKRRNSDDANRTKIHRNFSMLLASLMLILAILACGTVVTDTPYYTCPTSIPPTAVPEPTVLLGTPLPFPTLIPLPPTPYSITPPQEFYVGDAVFVGQPGAPLRLRFRLQNVQIQPAVSQNLVTWALEIHNLGSAAYETIPVALMVITQITTANGDHTGTWRTSDTAMTAAGFTNENYDPLTPGSTHTYRLAAYIPAGSVRQFAYLLDGDGGNHITWVNAANRYCSGDVAD